MKNAVIYARYSSHAQNEQTIEGQIRVCSDYAQKMGLNIVKIYIDKHKTGTDVNRPQFQQMIEDSKSKAFQYVIVYMLDRFARNRYYSTIYSFQLSQNGVQIVSAMENISESEEGELYRLFLEWNAEQYSKRLSKRVLSGITTSVEKGTYTGGHIIYGYVVKDKKVYVNNEQAEVVKFVYEQYSKGFTKKEIANELNLRGITYRNNPFTVKSFDNMLTNHKYTGEFILGGRKCCGMFPQIIDKSLFDKVQKQLAKNKLVGGAFSAKESYLLQGKLYCGYCGSKMIADGGTSHTGKQYHYYVCKSHKKSNNCNKKNEEKNMIESNITKHAYFYLSNLQRIKFIAKDVMSYYNKRTSYIEVARVNKRIANLNQEIDNAIIGMTKTKNDVTFKKLDERISELGMQVKDMQKYKEKLEAEQMLNLNEQHIIKFIQSFLNGKMNDKIYQKRIIDNLINSVYLYDDKIVIYFNISGKEIEQIGKNDTETAFQKVQALSTSGSH